jgi:hypothetical protein
MATGSGLRTSPVCSRHRESRFGSTGRVSPGPRVGAPRSFAGSANARRSSSPARWPLRARVLTALTNQAKSARIGEQTPEGDADTWQPVTAESTILSH